MPTYEYECTHCGYNFEAFQKITDKYLNACPKCDKKVRRLISGGAGIIFKGSGFYATDYRNKPKPEGNGLASGGQSHKAETSVCPKAKEGCDSCPHNK